MTYHCYNLDVSQEEYDDIEEEYVMLQTQAFAQLDTYKVTKMIIIKIIRNMNTMSLNSKCLTPNHLLKVQ